ncbi:KilA-N domain-containing protein [Gallibacterium sp. AGMB14963]|uniref:KilA-N domain-containing protein n=1 Tax=Gallibacterium faecale TaxID=3019086 RepID=UPI0022F15581|nr:KilA-N domain-containing protein [Gallibacterium sp. AGMB14963]MDA3979864.1 KilA-N domain-containing protein [Gallibacterium sp. AGMB14963]
MSNIISTSFNDISVSFLNNGYLNATNIAKALNKQVNDYLRLDRTQSYIIALAKNFSEKGNPVSQQDLVIVKKGNSKKFTQGTWLHPKLAIDFARWLNVEFAIWCDEQIEKILIGQNQVPTFSNNTFSNNTFSNNTITPEQQQAIQNAVQKAHHRTGLHWQEIYRLLKVEFKIAKYDQLPQSQFLVAMAFIHNLQRPTLPEPPKPKMIEIDADVLDGVIKCCKLAKQHGEQLEPAIRNIYISLGLNQHFKNNFASQAYDLAHYFNYWIDEAERAYLSQTAPRLR